MSSLRHNNSGTLPICHFAPPGISRFSAWRAVLDLFERKGLAEQRYGWHAFGSKRHRNRNVREESSGKEILRALEMEEVTDPTSTSTSTSTEPGGNTTDLVVERFRGSNPMRIGLQGPYPRIPWQSLRVWSPVVALSVEESCRLIDELAQTKLCILGIVVDRDYFGSQQAFRKDRLSGRVEDFSITPLHSTNPGRQDRINDGPAMVAADMWMGQAFWTYAPCTKAEVLAQHWLEVRDTEHYLYIKAYPEPFTRPDGEQGEVQRQLWQLLFHSDSHWPPGEGQPINPTPTEGQ